MDGWGQRGGCEEEGGVVFMILTCMGTQTSFLFGAWLKGEGILFFSLAILYEVSELRSHGNL